MQCLEKHVNFENENSRKAYYREFKKVSGCSAHNKGWYVSTLCCNKAITKIISSPFRNILPL